jgi:hypothetical protein
MSNGANFKISSQNGTMNVAYLLKILSNLDPACRVFGQLEIELPKAQTEQHDTSHKQILHD